MLKRNLNISRLKKKVIQFYVYALEHTLGEKTNSILKAWKVKEQKKIYHANNNPKRYEVTLLSDKI